MAAVGPASQLLRSSCSSPWRREHRHPGPTTASGSSSSGGSLKAYVPTELRDAITQNPDQTFDVIVQGSKNGNANGFYKKLTGDNYSSSVKQQFSSINGVEANLTGSQILALGNTAVRDLDHGERDGQDGRRSAPELELAALALGDRCSGSTG